MWLGHRNGGVGRMDNSIGDKLLPLIKKNWDSRVMECGFRYSLLAAYCSEKAVAVAEGV